MSKRFAKQLLSFVVAAAVSMTSVIPSYAMNPDEPGFENPAPEGDPVNEEDPEPEQPVEKPENEGEQGGTPATPEITNIPENTTTPENTVTPDNADGNNAQNPGQDNPEGEPVLENTVSVTLNANGGLFDNGEETYVISVAENSSIADLVKTPVKEGSDFTGWYYDAEASQQVDLSSYAASDNTVLYAGYSEIVIEEDSEVNLLNAKISVYYLDANGGIL